MVGIGKRAYIVVEVTTLSKASALLFRRRAQIFSKIFSKTIDKLYFSCYNKYIKDEGKHQKTRKAISMSKMMNVAVNSTLLNEGPTRNAIARIKVANKLIEILEDRISHSLKEIEAIIIEDMSKDYLNSTSVKSILEWFEQMHLVTTEIRKEEFIEKESWTRVSYDKEKNEIPTMIKATTQNGDMVEVVNPRIHSQRTEKRVIKFQVKRRYYTWVA